MVSLRTIFVAFSFLTLPLSPLKAQDLGDDPAEENLAPDARASQADEVCYKKTSVLNVNNSQVLGWVASTSNGYEARAHVTGKVLRLFNIPDGHTHVSVQIGKTPDEAIEVVYSDEYGKLPKLATGTPFEACGDYITSNKAANGYPASADGAIIHWVHASDSKSHESGFVIVDGKVYGND